jgi:hypothetical protein
MKCILGHQQERFSQGVSITPADSSIAMHSFVVIRFHPLFDDQPKISIEAKYGQ